MQHRQDLVGLAHLLEVVRKLDELLLHLDLHLQLEDLGHAQVLAYLEAGLALLLALLDHRLGQRAPDVLDDLVVGVEDVPDALGALQRVQEVGDQRDADRDEGDELRADVREGSVQAVQDAHQEELVSEDSLEELPDLDELRLLAE